MNKVELEILIRKVESGLASAQREYGSMLSTGRYFSKELMIPRDKPEGLRLLTDAAFSGDEEATELLVKYHPHTTETSNALAHAMLKDNANTKRLLLKHRLQTEETFDLLGVLSSDRDKYKKFMRNVKRGSYDVLRQYGELLYYGGECFRPVRIRRDVRQAKKYLLRSAFNGNNEAYQHLLDHNMLRPNEFEKRRLDYSIDQRIRRTQPLSWKKFLFGVSTGLTTYMISKVVIGEGIISSGAIGLATFALIIAVLLART